MEIPNLLKILFENKNKYGFINEKLITENTFMQQTSKGNYLWKAQIGLTKSYVIILRPAISPAFLRQMNKNSSTLESTKILLNVIPRQRLKIKENSSRTLKIQFPTSCVSYFKLLPCRNIYRAWKNWRAVEQHGQEVTRDGYKAKLLMLTDLDASTLKVITEGQFLKVFQILEKLNAQNSYDTTPFKYDTSSEPRVVEKDIIKTYMDSEFMTSAVLSLEGDDKVDSEESKKLAKAIQQINLIPRLATDSRLKPETSISSVDNFNLRKENDINNNNYEEIIDNRIFDRGDKYTAPPASLNRAKKIKKHKHIQRFGKGIAEGCVFGLSLSYSDEIATDTSPLNIKKQKKLRDIHSSREIDTESFSNLCTESFQGNGTGRIHVNNSIKYTLLLPNLSLTLIPDGLRRSKSMDSIQCISAKSHEQTYLTQFASMPCLHEVGLYRKWNRLSFAMDHIHNAKLCSSGEHTACSSSFWITEKDKLNGWIYCTAPLGHLKKAQHSRDRILRSTTGEVFGKDWPESFILKGRTRQKNICGSPKFYNERKTSLMIPSPVQGSNKLEKNKNVFKQPADLQADVVAYELLRIQQRLFCEIETSELARFILKPNTVSEVNSSYLCGFIYFYERLQDLVIYEILHQENVEQASHIFCIYLQVALECLNRNDMQSASAITGALCSPLVLRDSFWNHLKQAGLVKNLVLLFKKWETVQANTTGATVPTFFEFITLLIKRFLSDLHIQGTSKNLPRRIMEIIFSSRRKNTKHKKVFAELRTNGYGMLGNLLKIIEECRKYYSFNPLLTADKHTRNYLLFKPYRVFV